MWRNNLWLKDYVPCGKVGGGVSSLKDFYRDKVLNGGYSTELPISITSSRITINEGGKAVVDTVNQQVYFYIDMTLQTASTNNWTQFGSFGSNLANYLPKYYTNSRATYVELTTDSSSDKKISCYIGYLNSTYPRVFACGYGGGGSSFAIGDRVIIYGSWSY